MSLVALIVCSDAALFLALVVLVWHLVRVEYRLDDMEVSLLELQQSTAATLRTPTASPTGAPRWENVGAQKAG